MVMHYVFDMGAPATVAAVGQTMAASAASHRMTRTQRAVFDRGGAHLFTGVIVRNFAPSPLPFPDPVEERFGFNPVVHVGFRLERGLDFHLQELDIVRLIAAVLTDVDGDALFTFDGELTILARLGGRLTINSDTDFWTPDQVALLPPHETARLPNP